MKDIKKQLGIAVGLSVFIFLCLYVAVKLSLENLQAEKTRRQDLIITLQNKKLGFVAREQALEDESTITEIAATQLGCVRETSTIYNLNVPSEDIERVKILINKKYEH